MQRSFYCVHCQNENITTNRLATDRTEKIPKCYLNIDFKSVSEFSTLKYCSVERKQKNSRFSRSNPNENRQCVLFSQCASAKSQNTDVNVNCAFDCSIHGCHCREHSHLAFNSNTENETLTAIRIYIFALVRSKMRILSRFILHISLSFAGCFSNCSMQLLLLYYVKSVFARADTRSE